MFQILSSRGRAVHYLSEVVQSGHLKVLKAFRISNFCPDHSETLKGPTAGVVLEPVWRLTDTLAGHCVTWGLDCRGFTTSFPGKWKIFNHLGQFSSVAATLIVYIDYRICYKF